MVKTADSMVAILTGSATDDGDERSDYFRSPPCQQELQQALAANTPIIWLHETDPLHGGISLESHLRDCPEGLRGALQAAIAEGRVIEWYRIRAFQDVSLRLLSAGVLVKQLEAAKDTVCHHAMATLSLDISIHCPQPNPNTHLTQNRRCFTQTKSPRSRSASNRLRTVSSSTRTPRPTTRAPPSYCVSLRSIRWLTRDQVVAARCASNLRSLL